MEASWHQLRSISAERDLRLDGFRPVITSRVDDGL
jgi:hypothetical protein